MSARARRAGAAALLALLAALAARWVARPADAQEGGALEGGAPAAGARSLAREAAEELRAAIDAAAPSVVGVKLRSGKPLEAAVRWRLFRQVTDRRAGAGVITGPRQVLVHDVQARYADAVYELTLASGRVVRATLERRVPNLELALLRADEDLGAPPLRFGRSTDLRAGELVLALGDPFEAAHDGQLSATCGTCEGRARLDAREVAFEGEVLLTSAAVNPGSEGGALIDLEGRLVGLIAPLAADRRLEPPSPRPGAGVQGLLGYAIPVEVCRRALAGARRPDLGFLARGATDGVRVERVEPQGRAARAGMRAGDVIVAAGGKRLRTTAELHLALEQEGPWKLTVLRGGQRVELVVEVAR
ncbi:MAG: S1C family serine protease [Planctomycetota bacterium]